MKRHYSALGVTAKLEFEKADYYCRRILHVKQRELELPLSSRETFNGALSEAIEDKVHNGYMVARFGGNEVRACAEAYAIENGLLKDFSPRTYKRMKLQAGFFTNEHEQLMRFYGLMKESVQYLDWLGVWGSILQGYVLNMLEFPSSCSYTSLANLEPYYNEANPWSKSLRGKKVLVIHPFAETIESQFKKNHQLFPGTDILPEFEIQTIKAVQTIAGEVDSRFCDWFDAFNWMASQVKGKEFDVAIIGCGAYGFPLAAVIKRMGKVAVHLGGATQVLFGIKGARWDQNSAVNCWYNEAWTRPSQDERPKSADSVESACYW